MFTIEKYHDLILKNIQSNEKERIRQYKVGLVKNILTKFIADIESSFIITRDEWDQIFDLSNHKYYLYTIIFNYFYKQEFSKIFRKQCKEHGWLKQDEIHVSKYKETTKLRCLSCYRNSQNKYSRKTRGLHADSIVTFENKETTDKPYLKQIKEKAQHETDLVLKACLPMVELSLNNDGFTWKQYKSELLDAQRCLRHLNNEIKRLRQDIRDGNF